MGNSSECLRRYRLAYIHRMANEAATELAGEKLGGF